MRFNPFIPVPKKKKTYKQKLVIRLKIIGWLLLMLFCMMFMFIDAITWLVTGEAYVCICLDYCADKLTHFIHEPE